MNRTISFERSLVTDESQMQSCRVGGRRAAEKKLKQLLITSTSLDFANERAFFSAKHL